MLRVGERGLRKLRRKFKANKNNKLNDIVAPIYEKPIKPLRRKQENQANGNSQTGLKHYHPGGQIYSYENNTLHNAFAHRRNSTELRRGGRKQRKNRKGRGRKNRRNKHRNNFELYIRNGTDFSLIETNARFAPEELRRRARERNKRNKSKENGSSENSTYSQEEIALRKWKKYLENGKEREASIEDVTQKTIYVSNTISPLHPRVIIEEHDFKD